MPALYFIGVDTKASAVNQLFPVWAKLLGIADAELKGLDAPQGAPPDRIIAMLETVLADADAGGALVTTHKVAVATYGAHLFRSLDPDAQDLGEVGCILKRDNGLYGFAVDHISCGPALDRILGDNIPRDVLILGAGGAGRALAVHLNARRRPDRLIVTDIDRDRLAETARITAVETHAASEVNELLPSLRPGALVINATGLGKDRPGSPLRDSDRFPPIAIAWDLNYRGDLQFLAQARAQNVRVEDGWLYFVCGWTTVMSRVFQRELSPQLIAEAEHQANLTRSPSK